MNRTRLKITLTLRGPVLVKSSSPAGFGVDAAVARVACGPQAGFPYIPGTLLKGKLREALQQLEDCSVLDSADVEAWFGKDTQPDTGNEPERGCLHFGDLVAHTNPTNHNTRHGIAQDPVLGSAKGEMLRVIETPFAAGDMVEFTGFVWCYADNAKVIAENLRLGLLWLTQVGAERTTGFGRLLAASVEEAPENFPATPVSITNNVMALDITLRPLGPLCITKHKIGGNLFESEEFIPGNVIAGALAETCKAFVGHIDHFDDLVFRHAFPCAENGLRQPSVPWTTVAAGDVLYDVAALKSPCLLQDEAGRWVAPQFQPDWKSKHWEEAKKRLGIIDPVKELRVRTAIDSEKRMAEKGDPEAGGGALFAWEMIHPWTWHEQTKSWIPLVWKGRIDLGAISGEEERQKVARQLAQLLPQLGFLSKTKAACEVTVKPVEAIPVPELTPNGQLCLILHTPALLADPRFQHVNGVNCRHGAISAAEMFALYRAVWDKLSDHSLELSHHFARQFLAGGNHLALRFQLNGKKRNSYDPWLLTAAGSVFVFKVTDVAKAKGELRKWLKTGLPLPQWAKDQYGEGYKENPYRPQNGFGEIALHQPFFATPQTRPISLCDPILV